MGSAVALLVFSSLSLIVEKNEKIKEKSGEAGKKGEDGVGEKGWKIQENKWAQRRRKREDKKNQKGQSSGATVGLGILGVVEPVGASVIAECEWEEIEMPVDSGAGETVLGENELMSVSLVDVEAKRKGVKYELADSTLIPNMG